MFLHLALAMSSMSFSGSTSVDRLVNVPLAAPSLDLDGQKQTTCQVDDPKIAWNELIVSWNVQPADDVRLTVEARVHYGDTATKWYTLGLWSNDDKVSPRESVKDQADADGNVDTDTLTMKKHGGTVELRLTSNHLDRVKLLTACFADTSQPAVDEEPNKGAWGKTIEVPRRSQMSYPNGGVLCSPTSISMLLSHWSNVLKRPDVDHDVPLVAAGVYDRNWEGTGNWPFNTAFAGSIPGMRGYVSRFSSIRDLEDWIAAGIPVATSVSYDFLRGLPKSGRDDGHLVVLVGFTAEGDPIFNDPGKSKAVRQVYKRADFEKGWAASHQTVYLVYPDGVEPPKSDKLEWLEP